MPDKPLTVAETARHAAVSTRTVYNWIHEGIRIPALDQVVFLTTVTMRAQMRGQIGVLKTDLDRFLDTINLKREPRQS